MRLNSVNYIVLNHQRNCNAGVICSAYFSSSTSTRNSSSMQTDIH